MGQNISLYIFITLYTFLNSVYPYLITNQFAYLFLLTINPAKMRRRGNISLKLVAQLMVKAGFNHIITVDMHSKESQGFFDCAIDNLRASPFLIQYIQEFVSYYEAFKNILDRRPIFVSKISYSY